MNPSLQLPAPDDGHHAAACRGRSRAAFSLIEVLVATTLLVIIVIMVGMVFRQSTLSWDSGIARADGSMLVRSVVGAIERELRCAVDARAFTNGNGTAWSRKEAMGIPIDLKVTSMEFIALLEREGNTKEATRIKYSVGASNEVTRTAIPLVWEEPKWNLEGDPTDKDADGRPKYQSTLLFSNPKDPFAATLSFQAPAAAGQSDDLPLWVTVRVELIGTGDFSGLRVMSCGRDGKEDTKDDINAR